MSLDSESLLGARPVEVRRLVLRNALFVAALGIGFGLVGAVALTAALSNLLFEMERFDGATYGDVTDLLAAAVLLASYMPARRATRVDPTVALRGD